jgi:dolichol-phosphate mannosyltransferase
MQPQPQPFPRFLMVVPTYNERSNLADLAERFFAAPVAADLLVVDDQSPDGTAALCRELQARFPRLQLLERSGPRGLGRAYLAGLRAGLEAGYDAIGTMDGDLSHDPAYLERMVELLGQADVVIGSRYVRDGGTVNWRLRRILLSWLANRFAAGLLRVPAHDVTSGFRLYRAAALRRIALDEIRSTGYSFLVEVLYRLYRSGARIAEAPILFVDRTLGESKLGTREIYLGALQLLRMRATIRRPAPPPPPAADPVVESGSKPDPG